MNIRPIWVIYSHFPDLLPKISSILLKSVKISINNTADVIFGDKKILLTFLIDFFLAKISDKYFKSRPLSSKNAHFDHKISFFLV